MLPRSCKTTRIALATVPIICLACVASDKHPTDSSTSNETGADSDDSTGETESGESSDSSGGTGGDDSGDHGGTDTGADDTADAPDLCDRDLDGARNVKLCGDAGSLYVGLSMSVGASPSAGTFIAIGSEGWLGHTDTVHVELVYDWSESTWVREESQISSPASEQNSGFGGVVEAGSDLDGDGEGDLSVVAGTNIRVDGWSVGSVFVYTSPIITPMDVNESNALVSNDGADGGVLYGGRSMSEVSDVDGDGNDELLTGGYHSAEGDDLHSVPTLLLGPIATMSRDAAAATYLSDRDDDSHVSPGADTLATDLNGDGVEEIVLSEIRADDWFGAVYVIPSDLRGHVIVEDVDAIYGDSTADISALHLSAGDTDGDGYQDLCAATSTDGHAWLWTGPISSSLGTGDAFSELGRDASPGGNSAAIVGDLDGDATPNDVVFITGLDSQISLFPAPISAGSHSLTEATRIAGSEGDDFLGWSLEPLPDYDGDGVDDLLIGAPHDSEGGTYAGAAYLLYGASW